MQVKYDFLQKMLLPCGIPPKREDHDEEMAEGEEEEEEEEEKAKEAS